MSKKLWQSQSNLNKTIEEYTSGEDVLLDQFLVAFDVYGSLAHAHMLCDQELITKNDFANIAKGLKEILAKYQKGTYVLDFGDEDVHTRIENDLTKQYVESGAKLHTARSRNDQVLVDIRLYSKQNLINIAQETLGVIENLLNQADQYKNIPLPGMTHMQPAMLSSIGLWLTAFAESLLDDLKVIDLAYQLNDQSPLGSGAAYGVSLPIDRSQTAELLGFNKVQNNALYCQNSKGKIEGVTIHALTQIMATLNKFATDSLIFTTEPFSFISFDPSLGTGSSIMPQKQNWDALELMRAKYHQLVSAQLQISSTSANLPSGYNRDLQQVKGVLINSLTTTLSSLKVFSLFVTTLTVNQKNILQHIPKELFAAHWAYQIMKEENMPFRKAYLYVKEHLPEIPEFDVQQVLQESNSQGAPGNLGIEKIKEELSKTKEEWQSKGAKLTQTFAALTK